jgi:hypothetical protein
VAVVVKTGGSRSDGGRRGWLQRVRCGGRVARGDRARWRMSTESQSGGVGLGPNLSHGSDPIKGGRHYSQRAGPLKPFSII